MELTAGLVKPFSQSNMPYKAPKQLEQSLYLLHHTLMTNPIASASQRMSACLEAPMLDLPHDAWAGVGRYLDHGSLVNASATCSQLHSTLGNNQALWSGHAQARWPLARSQSAAVMDWPRLYRAGHLASCQVWFGNLQYLSMRTLNRPAYRQTHMYMAWLWRSCLGGSLHWPASWRQCLHVSAVWPGLPSFPEGTEQSSIGDGWFGVPVHHDASQALR